MIPKIIHYVWLGENIPRQYENYIESWHKLLPDYKIMRWDESNFDFSDCEYACEAYKAGKLGFVSDYIRLCVLKQYGGIYLDTDVAVLKSFDDLLDLSMFIGFENVGYVESAIIGCKPEHPLINRLLSCYRNRHFSTNGKYDLTPNTVYITCVLRKYSDLPGAKLRYTNAAQTVEFEGQSVTVFPCEYFAPIDYTTGVATVTENTYAMHLFAGSWVEKNSKMRDKFLRGVRYFFGKRIFNRFTQMYVDGCLKSINRSLDNKQNFS